MYCADHEIRSSIVSASSMMVAALFVCLLADSALSCPTGHALVTAFTGVSFPPSARIRCHTGLNRRDPLVAPQMFKQRLAP